MMSNRIKFCANSKKTVPVEIDILSNNFAKKLAVKDSIIDPASSVSIAVKTKGAQQYEQYDESFQEIVSKINDLNSSEKNKSEVYNILQSSIHIFSDIIEVCLENQCSKNCETKLQSKFTAIKKHVIGKIEMYKSVYRRNKELKKTKEYVEPKELAISQKWKTRRDLKSGLPDYIIDQSTFQYVSIIETLRQLFGQDDFRKLYFEFNSKENHICQNGVYERFCCSETGKENAIFQDTKSIKIRLGTDDFDICDAIKSKKVIHKITAVYFTIENMPTKFASKLDNIFLVSLCETINLKAAGNSFDEIAVHIINDIKYLETIGIEAEDRVLKGGLAFVASDNLGANSSLGFVESFNSYFCRLCEVNRNDSKQLLREQPDLMRSKESYKTCVDAAKNFTDRGKPIDFKHTKGIKRECIFNCLESFHVLDNITLDVMHDINEGLIPFFLATFFEYLDVANVVKKAEIFRMVRDFNYGFLCNQNKPSPLCFDSSNLGQNASQLYFIMVHLPFIFAEFKAQLNEIWEAVGSLLNVIQIVYSDKICDYDISELNENIKTHYKWLCERFHKALIPKHHIVLHYPNAIKKVGPLKSNWMMRFEAKHKFFTLAAKQTNNFVNIAKTLARKHQEQLCFKKFATDKVEISKNSIRFDLCGSYDNYKENINAFFGEKSNELNILKFVKFNCFEYREGLMIIENRNVYEIILIINENNAISFLCCPYIVKRSDSFYHSIEVEKNFSDTNSDLQLFQLDCLQYPQPYERKIAEEKMFIFCDNLLFKCFDL